MRIWSKHSRPLTPAEKCAKIPTLAAVNPETFAMMLESDDNLETYTELDAVALDLHEPDPETTWSSDLVWVPKSILHQAREKDVKKLQQFETYEEVPLAEAEGQEIISSQFVDKWEENGELRSRLGVTRILLHSSLLHLRLWRRELRLCWDWHRTWKWQRRTFLELFFMRCWRNISSSRRQLSTVNQVLCGRSRDTCTVTSVRHGGGNITLRKRCGNWVLSAGSPNQVVS